MGYTPFKKEMIRMTQMNTILKTMIVMIAEIIIINYCK